MSLMPFGFVPWFSPYKKTFIKFVFIARYLKFLIN
jgi:hypothetical protein